MGKISQTELINSYFGSSGRDLDYHNPFLNEMSRISTGSSVCSSPHEFYITGKILDTCLHTSISNTKICGNIVHVDSLSLAHSNNFIQNITPSYVESWFGNIFNSIYCLASFSELDTFVMLLSGGYIVYPTTGTSTRGYVATESSHQARSASGNKDVAGRTTGTALGQGIGNNREDEDPRWEKF